MKKFYRNLIRVWKTGFTKSLRMLHIFLPLVLFFTIVITFAGSFFFAYGLATDLIKNFQDKLNIVVYFDRRASQENIDEVVNNIKSMQNVSKVEYIDEKQSLEDFKEKHKDEQITMEALQETGGNPFGASLVVFAKDPSVYKQINYDITKLNDTFSNDKVLPIEDISYENHRIAIDKFASMLKKGEIIFTIILSLVSLILLFIVYLALRFATQGDREEIKVMKLVGAPTMLMAGPTAVMGISSGVIGGVLSLILLYFLSREMTPYTLSFSDFNLILWYMKNILYFIGFSIGFGLIIGFFGSVLAIRRHL